MSAEAVPDFLFSWNYSCLLAALSQCQYCYLFAKLFVVIFEVVMSACSRPELYWRYFLARLHEHSLRGPCVLLFDFLKKDLPAHRTWLRTILSRNVCDNVTESILFGLRRILQLLVVCDTSFIGWGRRVGTTRRLLCFLAQPMLTWLESNEDGVLLSSFSSSASTSCLHW